MGHFYAGSITCNYHTLGYLFLQEPKEELWGNKKGSQALEEAGI